jgi:hypothetical protein
MPLGCAQELASPATVHTPAGGAADGFPVIETEAVGAAEVLGAALAQRSPPGQLPATSAQAAAWR